MTIETLGYVQFRTHRVIVSKCDVSDRIYCFKHTPTRCDLASFDSEAEAGEYIITPMETLQYYVEFDKDDEEIPK